MNILLIGDIVGQPGRTAVEKLLPGLKKDYKIDFVIANAENCAGGAGVTPKTATELLNLGVDVLTTGDHIWDRKEIEEIINTQKRILRPANFSLQALGKGAVVLKANNDLEVGVINLLGRVFIGNNVDCPFKTAKQEVEKIKPETPIIFVDIHAEATSEKIALGWYLDGLVSCVFGTHTHVQTADERILPSGSAFISDIGMTGPFDSVIGRKIEPVLHRFITGMPTRFELGETNIQLHGAVVEVDEKNGRAVSIKRIQKKLE